MYSLGQYLNPESNRLQWAVLSHESNCWYFARRYGKKAATSLLNHLKSNCGEV